MNWGGFAGGFSQGFNNGVTMGKTITQAIKDKQLQDARAEGMISAKAAQEKAIADSVKDNGINGATQPTAATTDAQPAAQPAATPQPTPNDSQPPAVDASLAGAPDETGAVTPAETSAPAATAVATPSTTEAAPEVRTPDATPAAGSAGAAVPPLPAPKEIATVKEPVPAKDSATPAADGIATPQKPMRFTVNGKGFATRDEALAYAKSQAPSVMDFMTKTLVPKMQEAYLAQGDVDKAEAWTKWAQDRDNEKHMKNWATAFQAAQSGDYVTAAQNLVAMHADFPDGNTVVSADPVKDKSGTVTGFNMKVKNDATGETRAQFVDPKSLVEYGLGALSPDKQFALVYQRQTQADAMAAKAAFDAQNDQRTFNREVAVQNIREDRLDKRTAASDKRQADRDERQHGYKLEEMVKADELKSAGYGEEEKAKLQAKIDLAKENGATPDEVKSMVRQSLAGTTFKKTTDPTERRALVISDLMKNDPTFSRAKPEDQAAKVNRMMQLTYGDSIPASPTAPAKPATVANPVQAPQPDPALAVGAPAPAGLKDGAYKDSKTGQPFRVQGGKIVPLQ